MFVHTCQKRAAAPRNPGRLSTSFVLRLGDRAGILSVRGVQLALRELRERERERGSGEVSRVHVGGPQ